MGMNQTASAIRRSSNVGRRLRGAAEHGAQPIARRRFGTSPPWPTQTAAGAGSESSNDLRTMILTAALQHVPQYGFSVKALQAAAESNPALQAFASSRMALEQLFPSLPPRTPFSLRRTRNQPVSDLSPQEEAALQAGEKKRRELQEGLSGDASGPAGSRTKAERATEALKTRLEYNLSVLPFLPQAIASLGLPDPTKTTIPSLRPYLTHVKQIAKDVKELTQAEASLARLATVYSLSEVYQISSPSKPSMEQVKQYVDELYESTQKYDGAIKDTADFGKYVLGSFKSIWRAQGY